MYEQGRPQINYGRKPVEQPAPRPAAEYEEEKVKEAKVGYSTSSKYIFREIELFMPETIGMLLGIMISIFLVVFGLLFNAPSFLMYSAAPPILVLILFWLARFLLFMPTKNRFLTARVLGTNQIRFSMDDIQKGVVPFDKSAMSEKIKILNPKKHTDFKTGKPVIILREGEGENTSISPTQNTSEQGKELRNVIDSVWGTAEAYTRYNLKAEEKKLEGFLVILCILTVVLGIGAVYFGFVNNGLVTELTKAIAPQILK